MTPFLPHRKEGNNHLDSKRGNPPHGNVIGFGRSPPSLSFPPSPRKEENYEVILLLDCLGEEIEGSLPP